MVYWRPTRARARVLHPTKGIGARAAPAVVRTGPRAAQAWQLNGAAGGRRHERHEGGGAAHVPAERGEHAAAKGARCGVRQRRVFGGSGAAQRQHCACIVLRDCTTRLTCLAPPLAARHHPSAWRNGCSAWLPRWSWYASRRRTVPRSSRRARYCSLCASRAAHCTRCWPWSRRVSLTRTCPRRRCWPLRRWTRAPTV